MGRYAEGTSVTAEASRGEITGILAKHGVERMAWSSGPEGDQLLFELGGGSYRLTMSKLSPAALQERDGDRYTYPHNIDWVAKAAQEWKRIWRANVLLLKAKLEFIDGDTTTLDRELMAYRVLTDGRTLEEAIAADGSRFLLTAGKR